MSHDVFISYSSLDKAAANAACAALESAGIRCWIAPRDIIPGREWGDAIIEAINGSHVLVLIFSADANASPQIRREVERAVHKGIPIIPLRIEDIIPTHALEYFIGTVHWLDALTPPLESHLRRLTESVKALLQTIPTPPRIVVGNGIAAPPAPPARRLPLIVVAACLGIGVAAIGTWWLTIGRKPAQPAASPAVAVAPPAVRQAPAVAVPVPVQHPLAGTFSRTGTADGYSANFAYALAADGTYQLTTHLTERGTSQGGNGMYRTVSTTGTVRTGTYHALGPDAIELINSKGAAAVFRPDEPMAPLDVANPAMLGRWRATVTKDGLSWTWIVQNNTDGTFVADGQSQDKGTCTFATAQWRCTSTVSGRSSAGTYRILDSSTIEITNADGPTVWQRSQ